jgi:hypothetical protein
MFHRESGPRHWTNARLVRYADDFVVMARYQGHRIDEWLDAKLEGWLGLNINREIGQGASNKGSLGAMPFFSVRNSAGCF